MKMLPALTFAAALTFVGFPASATVLFADSGWQDDQILVANAPSVSSPWTFDLSTAGVFRVTDAYIVGDTYQLLDGATLLATSAFTAKSSLGASFYDAPWASATYSKIEYFLDPGSYSFTIRGDGAGGLPAGFGVRLDTVTASAVPEPATWGLMIVGFGLMGASLRGARKRRLAVAPA